MPELVQEILEEDRTEFWKELVEDVRHSVEGVVASRVHPLLVAALVRIVLHNVENSE